MPDEHPVTEDLERFVQSASRPSDANGNARLIRHLLADCATCRGGLSELGWDSNRLERLLYLPGGDESVTNPVSKHLYNYDQAFANTERILDEFFASDKPAEQAPEVLLAELAPLAAAEQQRWVARETRFASPQLVRWLV